MKAATRFAVVVSCAACSAQSVPPLATGGPNPGTGSASDAGGATDATTDAPGAIVDAAAPLVTFTMSGNMQSGGGGTLCAIGAPTDCTTMDGSGDYALPGVPGSGSGLAGYVDGQAPALWPFTLNGNLAYSDFFRTPATLQSLASSADASFTDDSGTGAISLAVVNGAADAATAFLTNVTVTSDPPGKLLQTPTQLGLFDVPAGTVNLTFSAPGLTCEPNGKQGWPPTTAGATMAVPVAVGTLTVVRAICR